MFDVLFFGRSRAAKLCLAMLGGLFLNLAAHSPQALAQGICSQPSQATGFTVPYTESRCAENRGLIEYYAAWSSSAQVLYIYQKSYCAKYLYPYGRYVEWHDVQLSTKDPAQSWAQYIYYGQAHLYPKDQQISLAWQIFWRVWNRSSAPYPNYQTLSLIYVHLLNYETWAAEGISACE